MKSCIVTGATGLVGSHLVAALAGSYEVLAIERIAKERPFVRSLPIDLGREWDAAQLPEKIDVVVHLAQSEHYRDFPNSAMDMFHVNVASTAKLLDYARRAGAKKFVLASSGGVYGSGDRPFREETPLSVQTNLFGYYLGTKLTSELLAASYSSTFDVATLRFFFVYGPGQKQGMLMPRLIRSVREGAPITLQGENGIRINPIEVQDAVGAVRKAIETPGSHVFNVAGPEVLSLREIAETIGRVTQYKPVYQVDAASTPKHLVADVTHLASFGFAARTPLEEGLRRMIASMPS